MTVGSYVFKVNNTNTRTSCEICSKLTIKTPKRRQWRCSVVFIVNFDNISYTSYISHKSDLPVKK